MAVVTTHISDKAPTLEEAQSVVGGYVEMLTLPDGRQMLVDEDGRSKRLKENAAASALAGQPIVGNVVVLAGRARWGHECSACSPHSEFAPEPDCECDAADCPCAAEKRSKREVHLTFDMRGAQEAGKTAHPQEVMRELGITYKDATPQSIGDCWWFWFCEDVPSPLPDFLRELKDVDPKDWVH